MTTSAEPLEPAADQPSRVLVRLMAAASLIRIGETEAGLRALRSVVAVWPDHPLPRYRLAVVLAGSGRVGEALDALAGAVAAGLASIEELEAEPAFRRLRGDARFAAALAGTYRNRAAAAPGTPSGAAQSSARGTALGTAQGSAPRAASRRASRRGARA